MVNNQYTPCQNRVLKSIEHGMLFARQSDDVLLKLPIRAKAQRLPALAKRGFVTSPTVRLAPLNHINLRLLARAIADIAYSTEI
jgi:hypothetical protein